MILCSQTFVSQDISAVAKAWEDSPYLFIVKVQHLFRGVEDDEFGAEQFNFAFTSEKHSFTPKGFTVSHK